jgi:predicted  nucleic acid-binding Zn-ribbon protein
MLKQSHMKNKTTKDPYVTRSFLKNEFDKSDNRMEVRFSAIDRRFEQMDQRFDRMDERFEQMDRRFDQMDQRFSGFEKTMNEMNERLRSFIGVQVEHNRHELKAVAEGHGVLDLAVRQHNSRITKLEDEVSLLNAAILHKK